MRVATLLLAVLLLLPACSDDGPTGPSTQANVVITIVDEAGDPVPDLELNILNDNDYMQDGKGNKATTVIGFQVPIVCHVNLVIADVAGRVIRTLWDQPVENAGGYQIYWDGKDDDGVPQASGRYETRMVCKDDAGTLLFGDARPMLLAILDMDRMTMGLTDADGRIVLSDRTLFPHLYDLPDMFAYNENGEVIGTIQLTSLMRFYVRPEKDGSYGFRYDVNVTDDRENLRLTWPPTARTAEGITGGGRVPTPKPASVPGDGEFHLKACYPNPFN